MVEEVVVDVIILRLVVLKEVFVVNLDQHINGTTIGAELHLGSHVSKVRRLVHRWRERVDE